MEIDSNTRFEKYSNHDELDKRHLGGHLVKTFVRVRDCEDSYQKELLDAEESGRVARAKTIQDSKLFSELFAAKQNPNCCYKTYIDSLLSPKGNEDVFYPQYVSCLYKQLAPQTLRYIYAEVAGSRLANALGISTVFNIPYCFEDETSDKDGMPNYDSILSVDYRTLGDEEYDLEEIYDFAGGFIARFTSKTFFNRLHNRLLEFAKTHNIKDLSCVDNVTKDIIIQMLFKKMLCSDYDDNRSNYGVIINKEGMLEAIPCMDMELLFSYDWLFVNIIDFRNCIMNMYEFMPEELNNFMERLENLVETKELDKIMTESLKVPHMLSDYILEDIKERANQLLATWKKISNCATIN